MAERRAPKYEQLIGWVELGDLDVPEGIRMTSEGLKGAPDLTIEFAVREGRPEVVGFHLVAKPTGRGIRTADLHGFTSLDRLAFNAFIQNTRRPGGVWFFDEAEYHRARRDIQDAQARPGSPSEAELEAVAHAYLAAGQDKPTEAVQNELGYSRRTAERRIQQARERGLLPPAKRGRPMTTTNDEGENR
jgi:hypothetical protein